VKTDTGIMPILETVMRNPWFAPAGAALFVYLFLGLFEESFGITKPIRVALAVISGFIYKNYGEAFMLYVGSVFSFFGLSI